MTNTRLHRLDAPCAAPPVQFTWPFHYVPHPLCVEAAHQVQAYVANRDDWADELAQGKMLGVLVVRDKEDHLGFLAAYSGNLAARNDHPYFVPPVCDLLDPDGEFKREEREITALNHQIDKLSHSPHITRLWREREALEQEQSLQLAQYKARMEQAREQRHDRREHENLPPDKLEAMLNESRFMKAELRRMKKKMREKLATIDSRIADHDATIARLKQERKQRSEALQQRLFDLYEVNNALGERQTVTQIFADFARREAQPHRAIPPGGAGECCAPKLLQYAYTHHYRPLCMAEFWWGASPAGEVRHHGHFYPACRSKCLPILTFMLQGLNVESNPLAQQPSFNIEELYDDPWLSVVIKPAGMLSEPGKLLNDSALTRFMSRHPEAKGPVQVHRLDQETSGLLVFAKDKATHKALQQQFADHEVRKEYVALLDGIVERDGGVIDLPLRPNADDRPRQVVDFENGKRAVTHFTVLKRRPDGTTLVLFMPHTGRTHQLRVHASHHLGLGCPIVGDMLYGTASSRLMLHAASLAFSHPTTGERLTFNAPCDFMAL